MNYFQMFNQVLDQMMDDPKYAGRRIKDEEVVGGPIMPSDNVEVTPLFLIQQADEIVELAAQGQFNDLQVDFRNRVARLMKEEASNSQDFLDQTLINQEDWKEIPGRDSKDSMRYGALAGLLVRKEIYDQIFGTESFQTVGGDSDTAIKIREANQTVVDFWKWGKVPANVPSWGRNIYSNSGMMHLGGMPIWAQAKAIPATIKEMRDNGPRLRELKRHGLVASTFSANELKQIETAVKERLANRADLSVKQGMWDSLTGNTKMMSRKSYRWLRNITGKAYQTIEVFDKLMFATYLQDTKGTVSYTHLTLPTKA